MPDTIHIWDEYGKWDSLATVCVCNFWENIFRTSLCFRAMKAFHFIPFSSSVQFSSVAQSCPTLCNPMNCSTPGLPVHHHLPEFTQTHVHQVSDAIQPSHPWPSPSPPAPIPSEHQGLFQWANSAYKLNEQGDNIQPWHTPFLFETSRGHQMHGWLDFTWDESEGPPQLHSSPGNCWGLGHIYIAVHRLHLIIPASSMPTEVLILRVFPNKLALCKSLS